MFYICLVFLPSYTSLKEIFTPHCSMYTSFKDCYSIPYTILCMSPNTCPLPCPVLEVVVYQLPCKPTIDMTYKHIQPLHITIIG